MDGYQVARGRGLRVVTPRSVEGVDGGQLGWQLLISTAERWSTARMA